jgi:hypothetical protein
MIVDKWTFNQLNFSFLLCMHVEHNCMQEIAKKSPCIVSLLALNYKSLILSVSQEIHSRKIIYLFF